MQKTLHPYSGVAVSGDGSYKQPKRVRVRKYQVVYSWIGTDSSLLCPSCAHLPSWSKRRCHNFARLQGAYNHHAPRGYVQRSTGRSPATPRGRSTDVKKRKRHSPTLLLDGTWHHMLLHELTASQDTVNIPARLPPDKSSWQ